MPESSESKIPPAAPRFPASPRRIFVSILIIVAAIATGSLISWLSSRGDIANAKVGDCVQLNTNATSYSDQATLKPCNDSSATHKIFAMVSANAVEDGCVDVPGAETYVVAAAHRLCMGKKSTNPATSINGIKVGECTDGSGKQKTDCSTAGSRKVLGVLKDVSKHPTSFDNPNENFSQSCIDKGYDDTDLAYGFGIESVSKDAIKAMSWERVLCLSAENAA